MDKIPSLIPTIVFIGKMNAGKSSLINSLANQEVSIVSDIAGTTSDEIVKRMELLDVGPINIIDTAGYDDDSTLAKQRVNKTTKAMKRASLLIYVVDSTTNFILDDYQNIKDSKLLVFTKIDILSKDALNQLKNDYPDACFVSANDSETIIDLQSKLVVLLQENEIGLLANLSLNYNKIVHVIPIDSEAPKGRLILPQMQLIRECLDNDIISIVLKESELENYLKQNSDVGLIVTDSQAFGIVSKINHQRYPLTSYSILQANQKGDLRLMVENIKYLKNLVKPHILIMESCSHNTVHEDIGRIKIPKMLRELLKQDLEVDFMMAHDFPNDLEKYDYIVHCGSCMLSRKIMLKRIKYAQEKQVPITNYGLLIAHYNGILNEAIKIFELEGVISETK